MIAQAGSRDRVIGYDFLRRQGAFILTLIQPIRGVVSQGNSGFLKKRFITAKTAFFAACGNQRQCCRRRHALVEACPLGKKRPVLAMTKFLVLSCEHEKAIRAIASCQFKPNREIFLSVIVGLRPTITLKNPFFGELPSEKQAGCNRPEKAIPGYSHHPDFPKAISAVVFFNYPGSREKTPNLRCLRRRKQPANTSNSGTFNLAQLRRST